MKYAIIEDEFFAVENLRSVMADIRPNYKLVSTCESVEDAIAYFRSAPDLDLVFMDIELVDGNCFEIFSQIQVDYPIIFITAYNEFAIQAFKLNSIDYLLKPTSEESILKALEKHERISSSNIKDYSLIGQIIQRKKKRILITKGEEYFFIATEDISYFISEDKYISIVVFSGKKYLTNYINLSQVENEIDFSIFFQVSRNIIANRKAIATVHKYFNVRLLIKIQTSEQPFDIIISYARKDIFLNWMEGE